MGGAVSAKRFLFLATKVDLFLQIALQVPGGSAWTNSLVVRYSVAATCLALGTTLFGVLIWYIVARKRGRAAIWYENQDRIVVRAIAYLQDDLADLPDDWDPIAVPGPVKGKSGTRFFKKLSLSLAARLGSNK